MRAGMEAPVDVLGGRGGAAVQDWDGFFELAAEQHVLPFVTGRLLEDAAALPESVVARLQVERRAATIAAFFWSAELCGLLAAFAGAGIEVILLKGPSLAERIYGGTARRISQDLDLLVRKADYPASEALLAGVGFAPFGDADDYHRQWRRQTCTVELHFDIENPLAIDFAIEGAWRDSIPGNFAGQPCRLFSPSDEFLFLCIHGVRHRFERLSLVLDIVLAVDRFGAELPSRREVRRLERLVWLGLAMARFLRSDFPMMASSTLRGSQRTRMESLAAQLWLELTTGHVRPLDWSSQHEFFLQTEVTVWGRVARRLGHLRIFSTRLIDLDFAFARRFGLTRRWQVWMLRPVRLVRSRWHSDPASDDEAV